MTDEAGTGSPGRGMQGRGQTPRDARIVLVRRLRARRAEIDEAIFVRVRDLAPGAAALEDPEYVEGLRAAVVAAVDYVLEGLEQEVGFSPQIPAAAVAQARRAARAGVGLDTLLRRYVAGHAILEDFVMREVDRGGKDSDPAHPDDRAARGAGIFSLAVRSPDRLDHQHVHAGAGAGRQLSGAKRPPAGVGAARQAKRRC